MAEVDVGERITGFLAATPLVGNRKAGSEFPLGMAGAFGNGSMVA